MIPFVLYCKSYRTDLKRLLRLVVSVEKYNRESLPFYVSVPQADLQIFREHLKDYKTELICDEDIIKSSPKLNLNQIEILPGNLSQQVVKSEFWRMGISESYLCLDSDSIFIRPFGLEDFVLLDSMTPYTVISEAQGLMEMALTSKKINVFNNFKKDALSVQELFQRKGKKYSFGPMPMAWHRSVWQALDEEFLKPKNMNFTDAIIAAPLESRWYGESLLAFEPIKLIPTESFFKVFHYYWQAKGKFDNSEYIHQISNLYTGIILQSSWEKEMDWPTPSMSRQISIKLRRVFK